MRYLLAYKNANEQELRQQFLFEVFHLWFVKNGKIGNFDIFQSFPFQSYNDILVIYGHNYIIKQLFDYHGKDIHEKNIFIISCSLNDNRYYRIQGKNVFLAPQTYQQIFLLRGSEFGFDFDVTEAEIELYNNRDNDILNKLLSVFKPISKKGR